MQSFVMAETKNIIQAKKMVDLLINRKRSEMVGLGLIYGPAGLGKTRFAKRFSIDMGYVYYRLDSTASQKTLLRDLMELVQNKKCIASSMIRGSNHLIFEDIVEYLESDKEFVLFIDEIDYAFKNKDLLGIIRDLADLTDITIILVGMQNAKNELLKCNAHYFDRCNGFCQFKPLDMEDTRLIVNTLSDIKFDEGIVKYLKDISHGTMRVIVKNIDYLEKLAIKTKRTEINYDEVKSVLKLEGSNETR